MTPRRIAIIGIGVTGLNECRALVDTLLAAADPLTPPIATARIEAMEPQSIP